MKIQSNKVSHLGLLMVFAIGVGSFSFTPGNNEFEMYRHDLRTHKSLCYSVRTKTWILGISDTSLSADTMFIEEFVAMGKIPRDKVFGGKIFARNENAEFYDEIYYDGSDIYTHEKDSASIKKWLISENGNYQLQGDVAARGVLFDFLDTARWTFDDAGFLSKSTLDNHILTINLFLLDTANGKMDITYTFKENNSFPLKMSWHTIMAGMDMNREITFKNVKYDSDIEKYGKGLMSKGYLVVLSHR